MKGKRAILVLSLVIACLGGALCSELLAQKKGRSFLEAAKATEPKSLSVRQLRIVDESGRLRATLDARGLILFDAEGKVSITLAQGPRTEPFVAVWDPKGKAHSSLGATGFAVADAKAKLRVVLDAEGLGICDTKGRTRVFLGASHPRVPTISGISFFGPKGVFQGQIISSPGGAFLRTGAMEHIRLISLGALAKPLVAKSSTRRPAARGGGRPTYWTPPASPVYGRSGADRIADALEDASFERWVNQMRRPRNRR